MQNKILQYGKKMATVGLIFFATVATAGVKVGDTFPDLASFKLEGKLPDDLKNKIVLIDFWASWCGPCKESFPALDALQKKYLDKGVVIVAVNEDEKKSAMDEFLKRNKISFTIVRDAAPEGSKLVDKVDIAGMPSTFLIDAAGKVRFSHVGFRGNETKKQYEQEIESLLKK